MSILVIGGGSWGTALAILLSKNISEVFIFSKNSEIVDSINKNHRNCNYLSEIKLNSNIKATNDLQNIDWSSVELIFFALPTTVFCEILQNLSSITKKIPLVICCKGLEEKYLDFLHIVAQEKFNFDKIAVLSGPNFAAEIAQYLPSAADLATNDHNLFELIQAKIINENLQVLHKKCLISVQIGGVIKNIAAIACGMVMGANLGNNLRSLIIAKAFREMHILCEKLGGDTQSLLGCSGLADLTLTCTSMLSKNMKFGYQIGQNLQIPEIKNMPEGFFAAKTLHLFCQKNNIKLPMCGKIFEILHQKKLKNLQKEIFSTVIK